MFELDADPKEALAEAESALDRAVADGVVFSSSAQAQAHIETLERLRRKTATLAVQCQRELEHAGVVTEDGHSSAKVMVRHVGRLSNSEAACREKQSRMWPMLPAVAEALAVGELGVAQFALLGRVHGNPRVRHLMVDAQQWFIECAQSMSHADFEVAVREWERLADMDGAASANQRSHERRDATMLQNRMDLCWDMKGSFGSLQGASIDDIFGHYISAERLADWEKARAEHGDSATAADLPRTEKQRRADAFWQVFQDAASADRSCVPPDFCHDIVWSADAFDAMLAVLDPQDAASLTNVELDRNDYCCETIDGVRLEPVEAASTSLAEKLRRVVVDAAGTVIDLGRARRFTGSARKAVQLSARRCCWPGCAIPTSHCELDHAFDHGRGGRTNPDNGAPMCGRHNRWKQKGFATWRDPSGRWHTYRPDGSEVP